MVPRLLRKQSRDRRVDHRRVIGGILDVSRTACPRRNCASNCGLLGTIDNRVNCPSLPDGRLSSREVGWLASWSAMVTARHPAEELRGACGGRANWWRGGDRQGLSGGALLGLPISAHFCVPRNGSTRGSACFLAPTGKATSRLLREGGKSWRVGYSSAKEAVQLGRDTCIAGTIGIVPLFDLVEVLLAEGLI
jgi:hypothetical protein